jgi:hypothetical protein
MPDLSCPAKINLGDFAVNQDLAKGMQSLGCLRRYSPRQISNRNSKGDGPVPDSLFWVNQSSKLFAFFR